MTEPRFPNPGLHIDALFNDWDNTRQVWIGRVYLRSDGWAITGSAESPHAAIFFERVIAVTPQTDDEHAALVSLAHWLDCTLMAATEPHDITTCPFLTKTVWPMEDTHHEVLPSGLILPDQPTEAR